MRAMTFVGLQKNFCWKGGSLTRPFSMSFISVGKLYLPGSIGSGCGIRFHLSSAMPREIILSDVTIIKELSAIQTTLLSIPGKFIPHDHRLLATDDTPHPPPPHPHPPPSHA